MQAKHLARLALVPLILFSVSAVDLRVPLVEAAKRGDSGAVRALLQQGIDVNAPEVDGTTALHWAAYQEDLDTVSLLIRSGASVQARNRYGVTPLSLACIKGNAPIIERLLKSGADVNATFSGGETALMTAARTGKPDAVRVLITHGANVNARDGTHGQTALMWAAAEGNAAAIQALIAGGADIHARSFARNFKKQTTEYTGGPVDKGAPIEFSALLFAVRAGQVDAVRQLLAAGANVNDTATDGTSALVIAIINAHYELASVLLDHGADPNAALQGWTPLHQLMRTRAPNAGQLPQPVLTGNVSGLQLAAKLIAQGANVNARMTKGVMDGYRSRFHFIGATPFLLAAKGVDFEMMHLLAEKGADPLLTNEFNTTPLLAAAGVEMSEPGEDSGTNEDAIEAVKIALDVGCDVNAVNRNGDTALHGAARRGANPVVQLLIDRGAKLDARNKQGWSPLIVALGTFKGKSLFIADSKQPETAALLRQLMKERGLPVDDDGNSISSLAMPERR